MTSLFASRPARYCLVPALAFLLSSCGGGGGSPGITSSAVISGVGTAAITAPVPVTVFSAALNGAQQAPAVATAATGTGAVIIDPNTRLMRATLVTTGVRGTAASINQGAPGINGPLVLPLAETAAASGVWTATAGISADQLTALQSGNLYFTVRSAGFPNGEIRGQILAQPPQTAAMTPVAITAILTGAQEAPPSGSGAVAAGTALIDPNARVLNAAVTTFGIAATGVSIREAPAGQNGPPVLSLAETSPGSGIWTIQTLLGSAQLSSALAGNYYFQAASSAFPNGEVRGQISPPAVFPPAAPAPATVPVATTPAPAATGSTSGTGTITGTTPAGGIGSSSGMGGMDIGSATSPGTMSGIGSGTGTGSAVGVGTSSGIGTSTGTGSVIGAGTAAGAGMSGIGTTAGF